MPFPLTPPKSNFRVVVATGIVPSVPEHGALSHPEDTLEESAVQQDLVQRPWPPHAVLHAQDVVR
jgi:hypothetical protein